MKFQAIIALGAAALLSLAASAAPKAEKLRMISFDVRQQLPGDKGTTTWFNRKESVKDMVASEMPDVMLLQRLTIPQRTDLEELLPKYGMVYRHQWDKTEGPTGYGSAVAWRKDRYDCLENGCFWISDTPDSVSKGWGSGPRPIVWARLKSRKTGREFLCVSVHFDPSNTEGAAKSREKGAELILERAKALAGEETPVFVGGDFQGDASGRFIVPLRGWLENAREKASLTDPAGTYNAYKSTPSTSVNDYILFRGAQALQYMVLNGKYGTVARFISDHYPILVNFRL